MILAWVWAFNCRIFGNSDIICEADIRLTHEDFIIVANCEAAIRLALKPEEREQNLEWAISPWRPNRVADPETTRAVRRQSTRAAGKSGQRLKRLPDIQPQSTLIGHRFVELIWPQLLK